MVRFSLNIKTWCLYVIWEKQDQIWAKICCIPKNMHSRASMDVPHHDSSMLTPFSCDVAHQALHSTRFSLQDSFCSSRRAYSPPSPRRGALSPLLVSAQACFKAEPDLSCTFICRSSSVGRGGLSPVRSLSVAVGRLTVQRYGLWWHWI